MKEDLRKAFVVSVGVFVFLFITGCEEQQLLSGKKARVIAAENMRLKKELKLRDEEMERLKVRHETEILRQKALLEKCLKQKKALQEQSTEEIRGVMSEAFKKAAEENTKLREENEKLKVEIAKLKKELQQREQSGKAGRKEQEGEEQGKAGGVSKKDEGSEDS